MNIYKGETGLDRTFQSNFEPKISCKCGSDARIMFVAVEEDEDEYISHLHDNEESKMWVHDAIAVAVYLCEDCFATSSIMNQA